MRARDRGNDSRAGDDSRPDGDLVNAVRQHDRQAFAALYTRYYESAYRFACLLLGSQQGADDLVSEAFAKVLARMLAGGGPTTAFRAYLMTAVRTTLYKQLAADKPIDRHADPAQLSLAVTPDDPVIIRFESGLAAKALRSLPSRWRSVLQWLEVEGRTTESVAEMLGIGSNAVWALAFRAREALRVAYLQQHLNTEVEDRCQETVTNLAAWTCGRLGQRLGARVEHHIDCCRQCADAAAELSELVGELWRTAPSPMPRPRPRNRAAASPFASAR